MYGTIFLALLVIMSSLLFILSSPPTAFAEPLRCRTYWNDQYSKFTDMEARALLEATPDVSKREGLEDCLNDIESKAWFELEKEYPKQSILTRAGSTSSDTCPGSFLSRAEAEADVQTYDGRLAYIESSAGEWQLDPQTIQSMRKVEQSGKQRSSDCVQYFEQREQDKELATEIGKEFGIDEEDVKELLGGEEAAKKFYDSNCVIATAAFGSEIAPQVQFLRGFRDNHILSTAAGSSFMNVFNSWYYSFSPYVADYERGQPWMQQMVRTGIYPLLGILQTSEKAYSSIPGEFGAMSAGLVASAMIGAVYFSPIALSIKQVRKSNINYKIAAGIIAVISVALIVSILAVDQTALMITSSLFIVAIISVSALMFAKVLIRIGKKVFNSFNNAGKN